MDKMLYCFSISDNIHRRYPICHRCSSIIALNSLDFLPTLLSNPFFPRNLKRIGENLKRTGEEKARNRETWTLERAGETLKRIGENLKRTGEG